MRNILLLLIVIPVSAFAIYGEDDRRDLYEIEDQRVINTAKAVAYQVDKNELKGWTFSRLWTLRTSRLENRKVCSDQKLSLIHI